MSSSVQERIKIRLARITRQEGNVGKIRNHSKMWIQALKLAVGSCAGIYLAEQLQLEYAASAGIIALLTIATTKWETLKLSLFRLLTFCMTAALSAVIFPNVKSQWVGFGLFLFLLVLVSEQIGWKATISVNAVIGTHFLSAQDFSLHFIMNEFLLVVIGITIAVLLNLVQNSSAQKSRIIEDMRMAEASLQMILEELAKYLSDEEADLIVWGDIISLEERLEEYLARAYEYQNNKLQSHSGYYIQYFEMRIKQCSVLHNLHYEMKKIRSLPVQAQVIADYIMYVKPHVEEMNIPSMQIERLEKIFRDMKEEPLPKTREEFENRAVLYHILMDLEEFLIFKKRFIDMLNEEHFRVYWQQDMEKGKQHEKGR